MIKREKKTSLMNINYCFEIKDMQNVSVYFFVRLSRKIKSEGVVPFFTPHTRTHAPTHAHTQINARVI